MQSTWKLNVICPTRKTTKCAASSPWRAKGVTILSLKDILDCLTSDLNEQTLPEPLNLIPFSGHHSGGEFLLSI